MKAIVVEHAGPPEVLQTQELPKPQARPGWVLIATGKLVVVVG